MVAEIPFDDQMKYKDTPFLIRLEAILLLTCFFYAQKYLCITTRSGA